MFRQRARASSASRAPGLPLRLVTVPAVLVLATAAIVVVAGAVWLFAGDVAVKVDVRGALLNPPGNTEVYSDTAGTIVVGPVAAGTVVSAGQVLAEVRGVAGTTQTVTAPISGTVVSLQTAADAHVSVNQSIATLAPNSAPMIAVLFVPSKDVDQVQTGLQVEVAPVSVNPAETGVLNGVVTAVDPLPSTRARLQALIGNTALVDDLMAQVSVNAITVELQTVSDTDTALRWTGSGLSKGTVLVSGTPAAGQIIVSQQRPWRALLGLASSSGNASGAAVATQDQAQSLPITGSFTVGGRTISLEVARTPQQQALGLMFRTSLADDHGMLFAFDKPIDQAMWMKNTLIPLDMVYVRDGVVAGIRANVPACSTDPCPAYAAPGRVDSVIELAAGQAQALGLTVGSPLVVQRKG